MKNNQTYKETQGFVTWWLCLFFVLVVGTNIYIAYLYGEKKSDEFPVGILIGFFIAIVLFSIKLQTRIDQEGLHIRFFPFVSKEKTWRWEELEGVQVKRYSPWNYGGWGYRFGRGVMVYTTKGNYGIHFAVRKGGKNILVGTQKPQQVQEILKQYHQINGHHEN